MCFKIIPTYGKCGHIGLTNPSLVFYDTQYCSKKLEAECPNLRTKNEDHPDSECPECVGSATYDGPKEYFKRCFQSTTCDHEYDHMITDVEREPLGEDIVLVTPEHEICPGCRSAGYDELPQGEIKKSKSMMPADFEGLTRKSMVPYEGSVVVDMRVVRTASLKPSMAPSRVPTGTYNPAASRVPSGTRMPTASVRPGEVPRNGTHKPSASKAPTQYPSAYPSSSRPPTAYPATSHVPSSSRAPNGTAYPAHQPSHVPSSTRAPTAYPAASTAPKASAVPSSSRAPSAYPTTSINPATVIHHPQPSEAPAAQPEIVADYLKRGAPKNVHASASYENPDGDDARAAARSGSTSRPSASQVPSQSRVPSQSTIPRTQVSVDSPFESRTKAPPIDAPSMDLDELMANATLAPGATARPSASRAPATSIEPPGATSMPRHESSCTPAGYSTYLRQSSPTQVPSSPRAPSSTQVPSASRVPSSSRAPAAAPKPGETALPAYKTMASPKTAFPSQPPPSFKTNDPASAQKKAKVNAVPKFSIVPEGDEDLYHA